MSQSPFSNLTALIQLNDSDFCRIDPAHNQRLNLSIDVGNCTDDIKTQSLGPLLTGLNKKN